MHSRHLLFLLLLLALLAPALWPGEGAAQAGDVGGQAPPLLSIPRRLPVAADGSVAAPVRFQPNGIGVTGVAFSIDYDPACLLFDPRDIDGNGAPDAVAFHVEPAFARSVGYDPGDEDGELDFVIADYSPPYVRLPEAALVTVHFVALCRPVPGGEIESELLFSRSPSASFSFSSGSSVRGETGNGSVLIHDLAAVAPPTATLLPTAPLPTAPPPTAPPTASPAPATATATPQPPGETIPPATTAPTDLPASPTATATPPGDSAWPSADSDGDGIPNGEEGSGDWDGDGIPNYLDADDDNDGIPTRLEGPGDADGGGVPNYLDLDSNGTGILDSVEAGPDPLRPLDSDGDGIYDFLEMPLLYLPQIIAPSGKGSSRKGASRMILG